MKRLLFFIVIVAWSGWMEVGALVGGAAAEDFRIDNAVFKGDDKTPTSENITIFHQGIVYDCMKAPAETVIFDKAAGKFTLLNLKHRVRAELTTGQVAAFTDQLQQDAARTSDPLVKFLSAPQFEESYNEATGELSLSSPLVNYRLTLLPENNPATMNQYQEFLDGCARLNALLTPGWQPFGRLMVNAALARRRSIASQVALTLMQGKEANRRQIKIRSTHDIVPSLSSSDLELVSKTREHLGSFKLISFDQYRKLEPR